MKNRYIPIILCLLCAYGLPVHARQGTDENIHITGIGLNVHEDSLCVDFQIRIIGIQVKTYQFLKLELSIDSGEKKEILPPIIYSGNLRYRYEKRGKSLSPQTTLNKPYYIFTNVRERSAYNLNYKVKIPYGRWMDHASLMLRQTFDTGRDVKVNDQVLNADLNIPFTDSD